MITDAQIWDATRSLGLDPWETEFDVVPANVIYDVAARAMPGRYSHWTYGKAYWHHKWSYDMGYSRIYELVVNTRPARAFLLEGNTEIEQTLVKAHVLAHVDFFRHSLQFANTDRQMDVLATVRADRIAAYEAEYGREPVEEFLTHCLAFEGGVEPDGWLGYREPPAEGDSAADPYAALKRLGSAAGAGRPDPRLARRRRFQPTTDVLDFLLQSADGLEDWQRDLLAVVRAEGLYFQPQVRTKIVNEGWASFWHQQILHELPLTQGDMLEFARLHAGITSPREAGINPYHLGLVILRQIEQRFGRAKLFEVRSLETDVSLLRNYLTKELVEQENLFLWRQAANGDYVVTESENWQNVRDGLCQQLANAGQPVIWLVDPDANGRRELLLHHNYDGRELDIPEAGRVLGHLFAIWQRPVHLHTVVGGKRTIITCSDDGPLVENTGEAVTGLDSWPGT